MNRNQLGDMQEKSSGQIDRLRESELQTSIFRMSEDPHTAVDFARLEEILKKERQIPVAVWESVLRYIQDNLAALGMERPSPSLILHWLTGLLRERGHTLSEGSLQSLELSLGDVELNIYHPIGVSAGPDQNPEATSQRIAQRIKTQFACRRVFQENVIQAHDLGRIELLHLGSIDRPHDVFLTPDYLKTAGVPVANGAPSSGPARRADVLLAHLIRFTHELRNHFAGDIQWGYVNTLFLPFLAEMSDAELHQFVQQMLFEFAQLDVERGGMYRQVTLDFDFDMPRHLANVPVLGPGNYKGPKNYGDLGKVLMRFNEIVLDILRHGDYRGNPFHSPRIVFHLNGLKATWGLLHQSLMEIAFKFGNPSLAFSGHRRDLGALGLVPLNDPDFLARIQDPARLRGFSSSSIGINLPVLAYGAEGDDFQNGLERVLELAVTAHRQKRLFISKLMAYGNRGPLQFLRRKVGGEPFLKIDQATQPMQLLGLGEAAALRNGSPLTPANVLGQEAASMLKTIQARVDRQNRDHKLHMFLSGTKNESVAYRFAFLDLRERGPDYATYLLRRDDQPHPIYTTGPNLLAFSRINWRDRFKIEGRLHALFSGHHEHTLFLKNGMIEDPAFLQKVYQEAQNSGLSQLQVAPDLNVCMSCHLVFSEDEQDAPCPDCKSTMVSPYGYCQSSFSPVHTWCLGKRSEWKIRYRIDERRLPVQGELPL